MDALTNKYCGVGEHEGRHEQHSLQATKNADVAWCPFVYQSVSISSVKCSKTLNSCSALPRNWMLARSKRTEKSTWKTWELEKLQLTPSSGLLGSGQSLKGLCASTL